MGRQTEEIVFGKTGTVTTDNDLWLMNLEAHVRAGSISTRPLKKEDSGATDS